MADSITCDQCGAVAAADAPDADNWIIVGWRGYKPLDACTRTCATELLDGTMAKVEADGLAAAGGETDA